LVDPAPVKKESRIRRGRGSKEEKNEKEKK